MRFIQWLKSRNRRIFNVLSAFSAAGIASVLLFSLPFFYQWGSQQQIIAWIITFAVLFLAIIPINRALIYPVTSQILKKQDLGFLIIIFFLLILAIAASSDKYWSLPVDHHLEICFDSILPGEDISIQKITDPNTNRLYSPKILSKDDYPIILRSGTCQRGTLTTLYPRYARSLIVPRLIINFGPEPQPGRLMIEINDVPSVVTIDEESNLQNDAITVNEGFELGIPVEKPWRQRWFFGFKILSIIISAVYFSLFLFGLTERLFNFPDLSKSV